MLTCWPCHNGDLRVLSLRHILLGTLLALFVYSTYGLGSPKFDEYTTDWAVHIDGNNEDATRIAKELGFENRGLIGTLSKKYHFVRRDVHPREKRGLHHHTRSLTNHEMVHWAEQQRVLQRAKRDYIYEDNVVDEPGEREVFLPAFDKEDSNRLDQNASHLFNDKNWKNQWYLHDTRKSHHQRKLDLHVIPAWRKNVTGRGVVVTVIDDGLEKDHPDIIENYDPKASTDLNDDDHDPQPRYDFARTNKHGTRCAGEISMMANNKLCGVGVAYNAKIGGIRMLDGRVSDLVEAKSLSFQNQYIDIYSASWGPNDDGRTMEGPGTLTKEALVNGATKGRGGKGVIYVWASGNGGVHKDDCECDGYTSSIYTISISSTSHNRKSPWYAEACPSTMATTYSSGIHPEHTIVSIDLNHTCTLHHTGTSASAPLAAGIFALALEKNPSLTWRDVQHLVAWTSEIAPLEDNKGWKRNTGGFFVSSYFGFGLLNAAAIVDEADGWTNVPPKVRCEVPAKLIQKREISQKLRATLKIESDACSGTENEIAYLEHIELLLKITYTTRGALEIKLTSPGGTKTTLLRLRERDRSSDGIRDWPFMSVQSWGEDPKGTWLLEIKDGTDDDNKGFLESTKLVLHGSKSVPDHVIRAKNHRRTYHVDYNKVKNQRSKLPKPFHHDRLHPAIPTAASLNHTPTSE